MNFILENDLMLHHSFINASINLLRMIKEITSSDFQSIDQALGYEVLHEFGNLLSQKTKSVAKLRTLPSFNQSMKSGYGKPLEFISYILNESQFFEWNELFKFQETKKFNCQRCGKVYSLL